MSQFSVLCIFIDDIDVDIYNIDISMMEIFLKFKTKMQSFIYFYLYIPFCFSAFISEVPCFPQYHLPSGLLAKFSHSSLSFESLFILSSVLNNILKDIVHYVSQFFSFRILSILSQCLGLLWFLLRNPLSFKLFSPGMYCFAQVLYSSCYQIIFFIFCVQQFHHNLSCPGFLLEYSVGDSLSFSINMHI